MRRDKEREVRRRGQARAKAAAEGESEYRNKTGRKGFSKLPTVCVCFKRKQAMRTCTVQDAYTVMQ